MFKNPGEKLSFIIKTLFWVLSIVYIVFDIGLAIFCTIAAIFFDAAMGAATNSYGSLVGNNIQYSGNGIIGMVIWIWTMALLSIVPVVMGFYFMSLFFLSLTEMSTQVQDINNQMSNLNKSVKKMEGNYYSNGNGTGNSKNTGSSSGYQSQSYQSQSPQMTYQTSEKYFQPNQTQYYQRQETFNTSMMAVNNPISVNPEKQKVETKVEAVQEVPVIKEEPRVETIEEPKELTKEDILNMYGPSGKYYK